MGDKLKESLRELSKQCEVLKVLYGFTANWDGVIWILRCLTRAAGG